LLDRDKDAFKSVCLKSTAIILGIAIIKSLKTFVARRLLVRWRRALCTNIQEIYLQRLHFYKLSVFNEEIDNPDQRITADVNSIVTIYGGLVSDDLFILPILTGFYAFKVYISESAYL
jgi:putative ATP-binding cassette transporter